MIAINMEMPKCCHWDCPLCNEDGGACMLGAYDSKTDTKKERAKDCPLIEIVTCKGCKHRDTRTEKDGFAYCPNKKRTLTKTIFVQMEKGERIRNDKN